MIPVSDGFSGYTAGQTYNRMTSNSRSGSQPSKADVIKGKEMKMKAEAALESLESQKAGMSDWQYNKNAIDIKNMYLKGERLQGFA